MTAPTETPDVQPECATCKGVRWVKDDSEGDEDDGEWDARWIPCPDCTDGICEGCDDPGHTCRECDEEWCKDCWDTAAHGECCPGKGDTVNDTGPS